LNSEYRQRSGFLGEEEFTAVLDPTLLENASLELARGRFAFAQKTIDKCLALNANNPKAHFLLAELFRQRGAPAEQENAEKEYQTAIGLDPELADAYRGLGLLDYKQGRTDLAKEHFEQYLTLNPRAKDRAYIEQYLRESGRPPP
jgi:tetratricopeptide (TPR) repeat protein